MAENGSAGRRLYLHVGLPKSGTTFLQALFEANRDRLLEHGILYPPAEAGSMFHAALEVRGTYRFWGFTEEQVSGNWAGLCRAVRKHEGTSVVSHEIFSAATPEQVAAALAELEGVELHLVVTARDLVRQVTAVWQENLKNGDDRTFADFAGQLMADLDAGDRTRPFWRMQDLADVIARWGTVIPPERTHVVTAPASGGDPLELWRRFAAVVGFDPAVTTTDVGRANESLGVGQAALLRDVNAELDGRIEQPQYSHVVKQLFAQKVLPRHRTARAVLPEQMYAPLRALAEDWVTSLRTSPAHVSGDLEDLLPAPPTSEAAHPDEVADEEKYAVARAVIADLLVELAQRPRRAPRPAAPPPAPGPAPAPPSLYRRVRHRLGRLRRRVRSA
jgi:hypothetical protein